MFSDFKLEAILCTDLQLKASMAVAAEIACVWTDYELGAENNINKSTNRFCLTFRSTLSFVWIILPVFLNLACCHPNEKFNIRIRLNSDNSSKNNQSNSIASNSIRYNTIQTKYKRIQFDKVYIFLLDFHSIYNFTDK